jgi:hypothetical protein
MSVIEHLQTQAQRQLYEVPVNMRGDVIVHDAKEGDQYIDGFAIHHAPGALPQERDRR